MFGFFALNRMRIGFHTHLVIINLRASFLFNSVAFKGIFIRIEVNVEEIDGIDSLHYGT